VNRIVAAGAAIAIGMALPASVSARAVPRHGRARAGMTHKRHRGVRRHVRERHGGYRHSKTAKRHRHEHTATGHRAPAHHTPTPSVPAHRADAGGCANTTVTPEAGNLEVVREATLCLINRERAAHGERPLRLNEKLARSAQSHSENMAQEGYFAHESPSGSTPLSRMRAARYIYSSKLGYEVGENIAWGTLWLASPKAIVEAWMASPGHRENILDPRFQDTGLGIVPRVPGDLGEGQSGAMYTQDFGVLIAA
jgi:uncharacterized protein YkwD